MNSATLTAKKKPAPVVRATYNLTAANGNFLKTQSGNQITVKY
jgi:hypothetical protein